MSVLMEKPKIMPGQCNAKVELYRYWKHTQKKHIHSFDGDSGVASSSIFLKPNISVLILWVHWQSQYISNGIHIFVTVIIKIFCNIFRVLWRGKSSIDSIWISHSLGAVEATFLEALLLVVLVEEDSQTSVSLAANILNVFSMTFNFLMCTWGKMSPPKSTQELTLSPRICR